MDAQDMPEKFLAIPLLVYIPLPVDPSLYDHAADRAAEALRSAIEGSRVVLAEDYDPTPATEDWDGSLPFEFGEVCQSSRVRSRARSEANRWPEDDY